MKKTIIVLTASLFVAASAHAVVPWMFLGISSALHAAFGVAYSYFVVDTGVQNPGGKPIKVTIRASENVTAEQMAQEQAQLPDVPLSSPITHSGYSATIFSSDYSDSYYAYGDGPAEFYASAVQCPSHICNQGYYSSSLDNNGKLRYFFNPSLSSSTWSGTGTYGGLSMIISHAGGGYYSASVKRVAAAGASYTAHIDGIVSSTCAPGYTMNTVSGKCDLTDTSSVIESDLGDAVCSLINGSVDSSDKDCAVLVSANRVTQSTSPLGFSVASVAASDSSIISASTDSSGSTTISQLKPSSDGGKLREDTVITSGGVIGPTSTTHYPSNPPPLYPGDSGGTDVPGSTTGAGTVAGCGAPGQSPCVVTFGEDDGTSPVDGIADSLPSAITDELFGLAGKANLPTSPVCPADAFGFTMPLPQSAGGPMFLSDGGFFCDAMGQYGDLIRTLSIACAWISATFIVLRA